MADLGRNIRYLIWKEGLDRRDWAHKLSEWLGCPIQRAEGLLESDGELLSLTDKEKKALTSKIGLAPGDLSGDLLVQHGVNILAENIRHLIHTLPHGQKKEFAAKLGVDVTTVSRWIRCPPRPNKKKLDGICNYFGLPAGTNLDSEAVFLWTDPIGERQMKNWIIERIERMNAKSLREIFPAMKRLMKK